MEGWVLPNLLRVSIHFKLVSVTPEISVSPDLEGWAQGQHVWTRLSHGFAPANVQLYVLKEWLKLMILERKCFVYGNVLDDVPKTLASFDWNGQGVEARTVLPLSLFLLSIWSICPMSNMLCFWFPFSSFTHIFFHIQCADRADAWFDFHWVSVNECGRAHTHIHTHTHTHG